MRTVSRAARAALGLAVAAAALWWWWPDEARQIRGRLSELARLASSPASGGLDAAMRAARLASFFTPDVVVETAPGDPPIRGRERLLALATRAPDADYELELVDVDVTVGADRSFALAHLTAKLTARRGGEPWIDARELEVELRPDGSSGEWVISRVTAVPPLERPR
ncbi:MAG TPA: nuclear transport factor 2 family protein [Vicinamibacterales bacterium]|nr:nuclear transport factor 2 family protein [Vicinamibacterales bacterium]